MSFFKEIAEIVGWDAVKQTLGYSYINYGGEAVYIEGIKSVLMVDIARTAFKTPHGVLYVEGEGLTVSELTAGTATVRGKITAVYDGEFLREVRS